MMTKTTRKNQTVKAFQTMLAEYEKRFPSTAEYTRTERKLIGAVNNRGEGLTCEGVKEYCKKYLNVLGAGATKIAYGTGRLAICFVKDDCNRCFGNQVALQVKAWERIALTEEAKYFNPVLSYGLHRGDKLEDMDGRYLNKSFIVSQRAEFYGGIREAIIQAYNLNHIQYTPDMITAYYDAMMAAADKYNIGDLHCNNVGVILDYNEREYRAVITDYGLSK